MAIDAELLQERFNPLRKLLVAGHDFRFVRRRTRRCLIRRCLIRRCLIRRGRLSRRGGLSIGVEGSIATECWNHQHEKEEDAAE